MHRKRNNIRNSLNLDIHLIHNEINNKPLSQLDTCSFTDFRIGKGLLLCGWFNETAITKSNE